MNEILASSVLVTGGCGFLGSHIVDALVAEGSYHVVVVSRNPTHHCNPHAEYLSCDVTQHENIAAIVRKVQPIAIIDNCMPSPFAIASIQNKSHDATKNLVMVASELSSVKAFIYTGSAEAVMNASGSRNTPLPESEAKMHTSSTAQSAYSLAKSLSQVFVLKANTRGLSTLVLCFPGIYGPREPAGSGITSGFLPLANTPARRIQWGSDEVVLEWVYVENAAHAHVLALKALLAPLRAAPHRVDGEAFFITDGTPIKLWDFAHRLMATAGDEKCKTVSKIVFPWWLMQGLAMILEIVFKIFTLGYKPPPMTQHHLHFMKTGAWFDITKARNMLGYEPLLSTNEAIQKTVAWVRQERPFLMKGGKK